MATKWEINEIFKRVDAAVRNERLHEIPDNDGDRGYMNGLRDARRAIERLRIEFTAESK